jgi:hypothetical protein
MYWQDWKCAARGHTERVTMYTVMRLSEIRHTTTYKRGEAQDKNDITVKFQLCLSQQIKILIHGFTSISKADSQDHSQNIFTVTSKRFNRIIQSSITYLVKRL